jgi:4-hydroxysphinganine ceramide fatty acyl 2-hydroxylase
MPTHKMQSPQIRLFHNEKLERLSRISLIGFLGVWCILMPMVVWIGWRTAEPIIAAGLFLGGLFFWFPFEYGMHRFLFHWKPHEKLLARCVFVMHGNHHANPNDRLRNLMPPIASLPIAATVWAGFALLFGAAGTWAFVGFILGYIGYDLTHYACHQWPMKGSIGARLKRHHLRHHHVTLDGNYAITAPALDRAFNSKINSIK